MNTKRSWQWPQGTSGLAEANARQGALLERWRELAMRLATTPAKTPQGQIAKLAAVAPGYADDEPEGTYDGILLASAVLDAQALG